MAKSYFPSSLRRYGGIYTDSQIICLIPEGKKLDHRIISKLDSLNVDLIEFKVDPDILHFPLGIFPIAAGYAESICDKDSLLVWQTFDTVILDEPSDFKLPDPVVFGYRPVHHTVIGSVFAKPLDEYWTSIYDLAKIPVHRIFPMSTHIDGNILRPYFNAGCIVVDPEFRILQRWSSLFIHNFRAPQFIALVKQNSLYAIFLHQAILVVAVLSELEREQMMELPQNYNYPIHLQDSDDNISPLHLDTLTTARYDHLSYIHHKDLPAKMIDLISHLEKELDVPG